MTKVRKASIDIGTNSTRLLLVDIDKSGVMTPVLTREHITRLGEGISPSGELSAQAMNIVLDTLKAFKAIIEEHCVEECQVFATSATRDAKNRSVFLDLITARTGFMCRVLSGDEEAELSFLGVISDLSIDENMLVCDVGGGSTEFIFSRDQSISHKISLDIGSRRLTRLHMRTDPPLRNEIDSLKSAVEMELIKNLPEGLAADRLVCVGGTATTLAQIDAGIHYNSGLSVHHRVLLQDHLCGMIKDLIEKPSSQRREIHGLHPDRADVILAGALIIATIFEHYRFSQAIVSQRDLLFGIFLEE